jgi:hypothetical protein
MPFATTRERLARRATLLKKSWILAAAMCGKYQLGMDGNVPDYQQWSRIQLKQQVTDLEDDLREALGYFALEDAMHVTHGKALEWLAERFESWEAVGRGLFVISTAWEFGQNVAPLHMASETLDIPPYAEILLQPGVEVAFRHPEYMLARDLELLYELYLDTELLLSRVYNWYDAPKWAAPASENAQALARTVILSCFNLLESFVSGLARSYLMQQPSVDEQTARRLVNTQEPLKKRVIAIPRAIVGEPLSLDINKPPFSDLFGPIKSHRDAFVHCEPGALQSERGYLKEALFHDVTLKLVQHSVTSTTEAIRLIWRAVHRRPGLRWLHDLDDTGHFGRVNLTVAPRPG